MIKNDPQIGFKKSSIRRHLQAKIKEWLLSIDNVALRQEASRGVIVTGGSIASMLLGEKINDYDLYFKTIDITEAVACYYVDKFNERIGQLDVECTAPCNPEIKRKLIKNCRGEEEERVIVYIKSSGVAAESQDIYKYFECAPGDEAENFAESLSKTSTIKDPYRPIFISQNAITLSDKIQLIIRFFGSPEDIHKNFDFIHAQCWYDFHNNHLELPSNALECLLSRTLQYGGSLYPIASIFRAKKFIQRGWRVSAGQLLKIMWQISELNLRDPQTLQEQLTGVDAAYMYQLITALQGVDSEKINSAYVATIIDRIFD